MTTNCMAARLQVRRKDASRGMGRRKQQGHMCLICRVLCHVTSASVRCGAHIRRERREGGVRATDRRLALEHGNHAALVTTAEVSDHQREEKVNDVSLVHVAQEVEVDGDLGKAKRNPAVGGVDRDHPKNPYDFPLVNGTDKVVVVLEDQVHADCDREDDEEEGDEPGGGVDRGRVRHCPERTPAQAWSKECVKRPSALGPGALEGPGVSCGAVRRCAPSRGRGAAARPGRGG